MNDKQYCLKKSLQPTGKATEEDMVEFLREYLNRAPNDDNDSELAQMIKRRKITLTEEEENQIRYAQFAAQMERSIKANRRKKITAIIAALLSVACVIGWVMVLQYHNQLVSAEEEKAAMQEEIESYQSSIEDLEKQLEEEKAKHTDALNKKFNIQERIEKAIEENPDLNKPRK